MCRVEKVNEPNLSNNARAIYYYVDEDGCHICTSHRKDRDGYSRVDRFGKEWQMHRYIYYLKYGEIPDGIVIMHICDKPSCNNINHLRSGTQAENMMDKILKNRSHKSSKRLSDDDLEFIKNNSEMTIPQFAQIIGASFSAIIKAKRRIGLRKILGRVPPKPSIKNGIERSNKVDEMNK